MQKKLIAMAVAGLVAAPAFAQSSVTLYGRVDMGYDGFTNDGKGAGINQESSNRIGFKGEEDLGGGWKAFFQLEQRFFLDNGSLDSPSRVVVNKDGTTTTVSNNTLWKDKAWVGLGNKSFGDLYLGRVHSASYTLYGGAFEAFGGDTIGQMPGRRGAITSIWSNAVRYISPNFGNMIKFVGSVGPSESGGPNRWGLGADFAYGGFKTQVDYQKDTTTDGGDGNVNTTALYNPNLNPFKTWNATIGYNFGFMDIFAGYAYSKAYNINGGVNFDNVLGGKPWAQVWQFGTRIPVGNGTILANYGQTNGKYMQLATMFNGFSINNNPDPGVLHHFGLGYWYNLSKRTILMANFAYENQDNGFKGGTKDDSFGYQFAVRHSF